MPNLLPIKNGETEPVVLDVAKEVHSEDIDEPPTPTNCQPPTDSLAVESLEVAPMTPTDSGSTKENGNGDKNVESEESNREATSDFESDSEADSSPFEALNQYVALPSVVVEDDEPAAQQEPDVSPQSEEEPQRAQPKLAVQEDFDLSPTSEPTDSSPKPAAVVRSRSRESVDSSKFAMTETEFSDWADNSLGGDLDAELDIDPEPLKASKNSIPSEIPAKPLNNGAANLDDIEFADDSEERVLDFKGYAKLVEEVATPDKPAPPLVKADDTFKIIPV